MIRYTPYCLVLFFHLDTNLYVKRAQKALYNYLIDDV